MGKRKGSKNASKPSPPPSVAGKSKPAAAAPPSAPKFIISPSIRVPPPVPKAVLPNDVFAGKSKLSAKPSADPAFSRLFNRVRPPVGPPPEPVFPNELFAGKSTQSAKPSAVPARILRLLNRWRPPLGPPPKSVFPNYPSAGSSTATPLPPPGMPKHRFLRRFLPLILAVNLAVGGYVLLSTPQKQLSEKDVDVAAEVPSLQTESIEAANS